MILENLNEVVVAALRFMVQPLTARSSDVPVVNLAITIIFSFMAQVVIQMLPKKPMAILTLKVPVLLMF